MSATRNSIITTSNDGQPPAATSAPSWIRITPSGVEVLAQVAAGTLDAVIRLTKRE
jgi:hypothetical protein